MSEVFSEKDENNQGGRPYSAGNADALQGFCDYLLGAHLPAAEGSTRFNLTEARRTGKPLQKMWQAMELSAHEFADEAARFFDLPRIGLAELMAATSLADRFSQRFLRESSMFPHSTDGGPPRLAVAAPTDAAAVRAAEIVLGAPLQVAVASFEDIATVLAARLDDKANAPETSD